MNNLGVLQQSIDMRLIDVSGVSVFAHDLREPAQLLVNESEILPFWSELFPSISGIITSRIFKKYQKECPTAVFKGTYVRDISKDSTLESSAFVPLDGILYFMKNSVLSLVEKINLNRILSLCLGETVKLTEKYEGSVNKKKRKSVKEILDSAGKTYKKSKGLDPSKHVMLLTNKVDYLTRQIESFKGEKNVKKKKDSVTKKYCLHNGCENEAICNFPGKRRGQYCNTHKLSKMLAVVRPFCQHENCEKIATYNYKNCNFRKYCKLHKLEGMVARGDNYCQHDGCDKCSTFNYKTESKALFCKAHMIPGMVNVKSLRCDNKECEKLANYNFRSENVPRYCSIHKLQGMIFSRIKACEGDNNTCDKTASFRFKGEKYSRFCVAHKLDGMIVMGKRCEHPECEKRANYNYKDQIATRYCRDHKLPGMTDKYVKRCERDGCEVRASFNLVGSKGSRYCVAHKPVDAVRSKVKGFSSNLSSNIDFGNITNSVV